MPKYRVCLQRYVEETAKIEVDVADPSEAVGAAKQAATESSWAPGDDMTGLRAYCVFEVVDGAEQLVWES